MKAPRLFLVGTSLLLLAGIRCAQAGEITIVSPSAYAAIEGLGSVGEDCCDPYRFQQVFPAADFSGLNNQPHWIVGWTVRPDQSVTSPRTVLIPDNETRLSTTQRGPEGLSSQFDENLGSDVMQFYRGPLNLVTNGGTGPGPREFYHADFPEGVTPFLYDPSQGNLLFDANVWQGESPSDRGDKIPGIRSSMYGFNPPGTQGIRDAASIFQFTFVPVSTGDNNASGAVEQGDLDLVLLNWGRDGATPPAGWIGDLPTGNIDQGELDRVLLNWGSQTTFAAVPEPSSIALTILAMVGGGAYFVRRSRAR